MTNSFGLESHKHVTIMLASDWSQVHYSPPTQQSHISYAMKPVLPAPRSIPLVIDPTLEKIDTAA